jgi:hypothetical protein
MRVQAWTKRRELAESLGVDPGVGCGALQSLDHSVQSLRHDRSGPCASPVRCCLTNRRGDRAADGSDSRPALGLQLWRSDGGGRNLVQASRRHPGLGHQTGVVSAGVRRIVRRDRRNHPANLLRGLRFRARHRNRPSALPVPLKSPEDERSRRQKTPWFPPTGTVQTGGLGQVASPGRKEFLRREGRSPRRTRRNHERERA